MSITIFQNINQTSKPYYISVEDAIDRIRKGKSKDTCELIRAAFSKEERNEIKKGLPSVCFGGKFERRAADALIEPSGFMVLDFDGFESDQSLDMKRFELEMDDYTYACWTSPSGDGLKVLVQIPPADKKTYKQYFKAIAMYYDCDEFDMSCSDISRVTYESYDPNVFVNESAVVWEQMYEEPEQEARKVLIPTDDANKIISGVLKWWDREYGLVSGSRNHNMFVLAAAFNEYGVSEQEALDKCLEFVQPDFTASEITTTVRSAYRNTAQHGTKVWEDKYAVRKVEELVKKSVPAEEIKKVVPQVTDEAIADRQREVSDVEFWHIDSKGNVTFINHRFRDFLTANGYAKFYASRSKEFVFVQKDGCKVNGVSDDQIKDFVIEYLYELDDKRIFDTYSGNMKIQKADFLSFLPNITASFLRDDRRTCYLFFKNCVVKVTADSVDTMSYSDIDAMVWESSIIDRNFDYADYDGCEFSRFLSNISGKDDDRVLTMRSTLGYMLHRFNDDKENKVVILNDEVISDKPSGGTGKGLFIKSVKALRTSVTIDGKKYNPKNQFAFERVTPDTQLLVFEDVQRNFDFEDLFSVVTEGMTINRKNVSEFFIPFDDMAKIAITTNYAIRGDGDSHDRRRWEVEFNKFYRPDFTPFHEFGHLMFKEWSKEEWLKFDNYMISNIQLYLKKGLLKSKNNNLQLKKFYASTSHEFAEWCTGDDKKFDLLSDREYVGQELMNDFTEKYPDYGPYGKMKLPHRRFYQWMSDFCMYKYGTQMISKRSADGKVVIFPKPNVEQLKML
jgi:hypothetical protein